MLTVFKMNRLIVSLSISIGFGILPDATAEIEFIYTIKEKLVEQLDNTQPTTGFEWGFGAGASQNSLLTAVSFTPPSAASPLSIVEDNGAFDFDPDSFSSHAELEAAFPNGSFAIRLTENRCSQDLGPFPITGDSYPIAPYFTNIEELQSSDHSEDSIMTWNAFSGVGADPDENGISNNFDYLARLNPVDLSSKLAYTFTKNPDTILSISPIVNGVIWEARSSPDLQSGTTVNSELYQVVYNEIQIDRRAFLPSTSFPIVLSSGRF